MVTLTLNLSKEAEKELEKDLKQLEIITKKPREFHVKEALVRYIEDMEDIRDALESREKKEKTYTTEELEKKLGI
jgi:predicted DNA-binding protein